VDGRAVPAFIGQALAGQPLTVFGDGKQTRSFCYIDDLVAGILQIDRLGKPEPINLGNPAEYTILQLAEQVVSLTGSKSEIVFEPLPEDDPKVRRPDIGLARKLLSWEPKVSLEQGLGNTIDHFRSRDY
jgi:dTDP-glucose 4,6-dehydratase